MLQFCRDPGRYPGIGSQECLQGRTRLSARLSMSVLNAPIGNRSVSSDHAYILEDLHLLSCPFHLLCFSSTRPFQKFPSSVLSTSDLHSLDARLFQLFRLFHPPTTSSFLDRVFRHSLYPPILPFSSIMFISTLVFAALLLAADAQAALGYVRTWVPYHPRHEILITFL
jgi:hypothetical protein